MMTLTLLTAAIVVLCAGQTFAAQCACAKRDVKLLEGPGLQYLLLEPSVLQKNECLLLTGEKQAVDDLTWVNVEYKKRSLWVFEGFIAVSDCQLTNLSQSPQLPGCPPIVTRAEWGARPPSHPLIPLPKTPYYMFIHHGDSPPCFTKENCMKLVRAYQNFHMDFRGWWDIAYSFIVGEDGNVYEGRGWDKVGSHTKGYNSIGLGFCVIGNFTDHVPNSAALKSLQQLIKCGHDNGRLTDDYTLRGHRDVRPTTCPGQSFYELIRTWPHYWKKFAA